MNMKDQIKILQEVWDYYFSNLNIEPYLSMMFIAKS